MSSPVRRVRVVRINEETVEARSIAFSVERGGDLEYRPGQFITVRVPTSKGAAARSYSLSSSPVCDSRPVITVKRITGGVASTWMCTDVQVGSEFDILPPSGVFTPRDLGADLLLLASGSGISPVMSILKSALYAGRGKIDLLYRSRDSASVIFHRQLMELSRSFPDRLRVDHWIGDRNGRPTAAAIVQFAAEHPDREAFICGPAGFMELARSGLAAAGLSENRIHVERFMSLDQDPFRVPSPTSVPEVGSTEVSVQLNGEDLRVRWPKSGVLLDALLEAGINAPHSCREGACSACICRVRRGTVRMLDNRVLEDADIAEGYVLACQAVAVSDDIAVTYDE